MKLLFICPSQFGYLIDIYYFSKYLAQNNEVCYLGWDYGFARKNSSSVDVVSVSREDTKLGRYLGYLRKAFNLCRNGSFDVIVIKYFPGCSILHCLSPRTVYVLDIRSGSVSGSRTTRVFRNMLMRLESICFRRITIISALLAQKLHLGKKVTILPVGSVEISSTEKVFDTLRLLYVGTLDNRNIDQTLIGLSMFLNRYENTVPITYSIIGSGSHNQCAELKRIVESIGLDSIVNVEGYVAFEELGSYVDVCNIGVSYIPKTDYYDVQPPTKTFDYLLSGMAVIATSTKANQQIIEEENGILIDDTPEAFCEGLHEMSVIMPLLNSERIRASVKEYSWENISNRFEDYLLEILRKK